MRIALDELEREFYMRVRGPRNAARRRRLHPSPNSPQDQTEQIVWITDMIAA
jgi:hypothetical protein